MMSLAHIQSSLKLLYRERHAPEHLKLLADVWWWTTLSVGMLLFVATACFSAYELIRSRDVLFAAENPSSAVAPALDKDALAQTLVQYESRAGLYSGMRANLPTTTDPSL